MCHFRCVCCQVIVMWGFYIQLYEYLWPQGHENNAVLFQGRMSEDYGTKNESIPWGIYDSFSRLRGSKFLFSLR